MYITYKNDVDYTAVSYNATLFWRNPIMDAELTARVKRSALDAGADLAGIGSMDRVPAGTGNAETL